VVSDVVDALGEDQVPGPGLLPHVVPFPAQGRDAGARAAAVGAVGEDLVAADPLVEHAELLPRGQRLQPGREDVRPAVVAVPGRVRAVGDGIAEGHDAPPHAGRRPHVDAGQPEPRVDRAGERRAPRTGLVAGGHELGALRGVVPGDGGRVAAGRDVEVDREVLAVADAQVDRVAEHARAGPDGDRSPAPEGDPAGGSGDHVGRAGGRGPGHADGAEGDIGRAERVGQAQAHGRSAERGVDQHAERLVGEGGADLALRARRPGAGPGRRAGRGGRRREQEGGRGGE
jgi:hypothetical protein